MRTLPSEGHVGLANHAGVTDNIDPKALLGLEQALFILECMCDGDSDDEIYHKFHGDEQLVNMWLIFLKHNHWMSYDTARHRWALADRGREWAIGKIHG
jgi:hypothetical protein